ncbi:hypothetical protein NQ314_001745 [Rhamnusium bicolor]|uniref:Aminotransferase class V domain-containing protein n=1 Tax=Rhamnusium bicolor TaxID=1586634 RepID=A0AAV8ZRJ6_9CUCU|nr:hypothetical protein NQ314_001745 [Rhamnusium bicolor]
MYRHLIKVHNITSLYFRNKTLSVSISNKRYSSSENKFKISEIFQGRPLYLDAQATTPLDPRVLDAMLPYLTSYYGNPHSRTHAYGWETEAAIEKARQQVAALIGADPKEIIFTSGATESNNIAVKGVARFYSGKKKTYIVLLFLLIQSHCFRNTNVFWTPVGHWKRKKNWRKAIIPETSLVSVMTVNNEIGVKQPIADIGALCKDKKVFFHTDAAQAVGKIPLDIQAMEIDLMSISGHKLYGPKGVEEHLKNQVYESNFWLKNVSYYRFAFRLGRRSLDKQHPNQANALENHSEENPNSFLDK